MLPSGETDRKVAVTVAAGTTTVCGENWTPTAWVPDEDAGTVPPPGAVVLGRAVVLGGAVVLLGALPLPEAVVLGEPAAVPMESTRERLSAIPSLSLPSVRVKRRVTMAVVVPTGTVVLALRKSSSVFPPRWASVTGPMPSVFARPGPAP